MTQTNIIKIPGSLNIVGCVCLLYNHLTFSLNFLHEPHMHIDELERVALFPNQSIYRLLKAFVPFPHNLSLSGICPRMWKNSHDINLGSKASTSFNSGIDDHVDGCADVNSGQWEQSYQGLTPLECWIDMTPLLISCANLCRTTPEQSRNWKKSSAAVEAL